ncbi:MAG: arylsulfatase [Verrucomicrobiota bacterium]
MSSLTRYLCIPVIIFMVGLSSSALAAPPNIVLLLTDDQGFGDLGHTGNPILKTPAIDAFAQESIEFRKFYVSPVCTPTRASLMTGRYNYRTGAIDTWKGLATMHQDEMTLAEVLKKEGYATGLFGKWHLGDTYPYRPQDQGFDTVLMHRGGGIGQPSDPPGNTYFNPYLTLNGQMQEFEGYCMDIYTDHTLAFIEANQDQPFFAYLATNTPHTPLQVPEKYSQPYLDAGVPEKTSLIYGMVANIDENFKRVLDKLDELNLTENTIVIFMSDNGPKVFSDARHVAGMRGEKTQIYEAGIRSPFFFRWPATFDSPRQIDTIAAHIDLMPTLLEACGLDSSSSDFDGANLLPLMKEASADWPNRTLFMQWHRGAPPAPYCNFAAIEDRYKLLQQNNAKDPKKPVIFELYDLQKDPSETVNLAETHPEIVNRIRLAYDKWFEDVSSTRGYPEMPSHIGSHNENPVLLTHQDRMSGKIWGVSDYYSDAFWPIEILQDGDYQVTFDLYSEQEDDATAVLNIGDQEFTTEIASGSTEGVFKKLPLKKGTARLTAKINSSSKSSSPRFVELEWLP